KLVVFVDGCYWHGCRRCGHVPNVNRPYWSAKIVGNRARDLRNTKLLKSAGYRVVRFWEHELLPTESRALVERLRTLLLTSSMPSGNVEAHSLEGPGNGEEKKPYRRKRR